MDITLTRRDITTGLLAIAGASFAPFLAGAQSDQTRLQLTLPQLANRSAPTFETFMALSSILLMRSDLDLQAARRYFELFMAEPWGPKHIGTAYALLRNAVLARAQRGGREAVEQAALPAGERWFISHVVTTWYIGVYYHPERPTEWITLHGAVMYDAAGAIVPKPYEESVGYGNWARIPKAADQK
jgi:hypothetical protein